MYKSIITSFLISFQFISIAQFNEKRVLSIDHFFQIRDVEASDLDNDGDYDLIISSEDQRNYLTWAENMGGGRFAREVLLDVPDIGDGYPTASFMSIAEDLDSDGDKDIIAVIINEFNSIVWYENYGNGLFGPRNLVSNESGRSMIVEDFDQDGDFDIATPLSSGEVVWYENNDSNFLETHSFSFYCLVCNHLYYEDLNEDGLKDIISSSKLDNKITWSPNLGDGNFGLQQVISTDVIDPTSVTVYDIDGDGDNDVFSSSGGDKKLAWYENLGSGIFGPQNVIDILEEYPISVKKNDFDNDGDQDLYVFDYNTHNIKLYKNLGEELFEEFTSITATSDSRFDIADIDNDGFDDLLCGRTSKVLSYKNTLGESFERGMPLNWETTGVSHTHSADLDGDGDLDLIASCFSGKRLVWFENGGNSVHSTLRVVATDSNYHNMTIAEDLNDDGKKDLITISSLNDKVFWFENIGDGEFGSEQVISSDADGVSFLTALDLELDGDIDIVSASSNDNKIALYKNLGSGIFSPEEIISESLEGAFSVLATDVNNDGYLDLLASGYTSEKVVWFKNLGDGTFSDENVIVNGLNVSRALSFGDLDNDGDIDIVTASYDDNKTLWFENLGDETFGTERPIELDIINPYKVYVVDINSDGKLDVVSFSFGESAIYWNENLGDGSFNSKIPLTESLYALSSANFTDIQNDGDLDLFTSSNGLITFYKNNDFDPFQVKGLIYMDENENGIKDSSESGINYFPIESTPSNFFSITHPDGNYFMNFDGTYDEDYLIYPDGLSNWNVTSDSSAYHASINADFISTDGLDFGVYPTVLFDSLEVDIVGGFPRCNSEINYWLTLQNIGTTRPNSIIKLILADSISFISSSISPDSIVNNNIYWHYDSLDYFDLQQIQVTALMPDFMSIGDTLTNYLYAKTTNDDTTITSFALDSLEQILVCAYDPNDKIVWPKGIGENGNILPYTSDLDYTIRFQNTGNDTAISVIIQDQLDPSLNWSSFSLSSSSHPVEIDLNLNGKLTFYFKNIYLPDSNANEIESHGFVKYNIELVNDLPLGTKILNYANIYFDFNPSIQTNTTINTLDIEAFHNIEEVIFKESLPPIKVYPNPFQDFALIDFGKELKNNEGFSIYNMLGNEVYRNYNIESNKFILNNSNLSKGIYLLVASYDNDITTTIKLIVQ